MRRSHRRALRLLASLLPVLLALGHATGWLFLPALATVDARLYDLRLLATMPRTLDPRVVIVDIDEASLARLGHWPWRRDRVAALVDEIMARQGAATLAFDIVFAEPDGSSPLRPMRELAAGSFAAQPAFGAEVERLAPDLDYDQRFAKALSGRSTILGYYFTADQGGRRTGVLPPPVLAPQAAPLRVTTWTGYGANLPDLASAAASAGLYNSLTDEDGLTRAVPLLASFEQAYYEPLALAAYRQWVASSASGARTPDAVPAVAVETGSGNTMAALRLLHANGQVQTIGTDARGAVLVPFRGPGGPEGGSFRYVSAADLLDGKLPADSFRGRAVLLGSTAPGLLDLRATPVGATYPGVEMHANLIVGFMDNRVPVRPDYARGYEVMSALIIGLILALGLPRARFGRGSVLVALTLGGFLGLDAWLYLQYQLVLPVAATLFAAILVIVINLAFSYLFENRARRELAELFGTYVPPELVRQMLKDPERYTMQAQSRELTVMFCDLRGFTRMAEGMSPTDVQALLGDLFNRVTQVIRHEQGTIDKYIGDCVMAFWGAPVDLADHASRAVHAALAVQDAVRLFNTERASLGLPVVPVSIGINSGHMAVGDMGSELRRAYTVIGDAVNLAARIEALTREYGVDIAAGETTRALAPEFTWQWLDCVQVKGRQQATDLYEPLGLTPSIDAATRIELETWQQCLQACRDADFGHALTLIQVLRVKNPTKALYSIYEKRIRSSNMAEMI